MPTERKTCAWACGAGAAMRAAPVSAAAAKSVRSVRLVCMVIPSVGGLRFRLQFTSLLLVYCRRFAGLSPVSSGRVTGAGTRFIRHVSKLVSCGDRFTVSVYSGPRVRPLQTRLPHGRAVSRCSRAGRRRPVLDSRAASPTAQQRLSELSRFRVAEDRDRRTSPPGKRRVKCRSHRQRPVHPPRRSRRGRCWRGARRRGRRRPCGRANGRRPPRGALRAGVRARERRRMRSHSGRSVARYGPVIIGMRCYSWLGDPS